jgi:hypothetical protein
MSGPLYLGQPVGFDGATPPLGATNPNFTANADKVATLAEYYGAYLYITSGVALTVAGRLMKLPLVRGAMGYAFNATTGGFAINVGGATGNVVSVPWGTGVYFACDGTNYTALSASGDQLELIAGAARTTSGTLDGTKNTHPQDSSSGSYTLTIPASTNVGERHLVPDWGGTIEASPIAVTTGTSVKIQHPLTGDRTASSFSFGASGGAGFRNGSCFELQWTGTLWVTIR